MKKRIRILRKTLHLTQTQFGKRIGVKGNTVTTYESGTRNPSEAICISICREFHVNESWLRTGEGDIFIDTKEDAVTRLAVEKDMTPLEEAVLREYIALPQQYRLIVAEFSQRIACAINEQDSVQRLPTDDAPSLGCYGYADVQH